MNRIILPIALAVAFFTGFYFGGNQLTTVHAQTQAPRLIQAPKAWGLFKGAMLGAAIFEDNDGTIRAVNLDGTVGLQISRK